VVSAYLHAPAALSLGETAHDTLQQKALSNSQPFEALWTKLISLAAPGKIESRFVGPSGCILVFIRTAIGYQFQWY
jgi:hypothetical protein